MKKLLRKLIKEADKLQVKREKLDDFIHCDDYSDLDDEMQFLLDMQYHTMTQYQHILDKRINLIRLDVDLRRNHEFINNCGTCSNFQDNIIKGLEFSDSQCNTCKNYNNWRSR